MKPVKLEARCALLGNSCWRNKTLLENINPNSSACGEENSGENLLSRQMLSVRTNPRIKRFGKFLWKSHIYLVYSIDIQV